MLDTDIDFTSSEFGRKNDPGLLDLPSTEQLNTVICGVGTAFPSRSYSQVEIGKLLGIKNPTVHKLLASAHIKSRQLYLPLPSAGQDFIDDESHETLNNKFDYGVLDIGVSAVSKALVNSSFDKSDVDFLICVTSTGFRVPGISSSISKHLGLKDQLFRLDVVGMGCNGGMSALRAASALSNTGMTGIVLCCEVNSASYVRDETIGTGIVNSLFGDGAAAAVISTHANHRRKMEKRGENDYRVLLETIGFSSVTLADYRESMRFCWNDVQKRWSFSLSKQIPFVIGENIMCPVDALLKKYNLSSEAIKHWTIHTGGAAVIDGARSSLGITEYDVRHTRAVLRDHGNISSGSFLVSLERLLKESVVCDDDLGMLIAMGPGATLEACIVRYHVC